MIWIIVILIVSFCTYFLILRGMKGPAKTLEMLNKPIHDLLKRGYNGAYLMIDVSGMNYFLQLRKYIRIPGDYGIELCFPNAEWSSNFFKKLIELSEKEEVESSITEKNNDESLEFLCIDFKRDGDKAFQFVKRVLLQVFEVDKNVRLFVRLENATTEDKLIDK